MYCRRSNCILCGFKSVSWYLRIQKRYKWYYLELNHFIIFTDVTVFESKSYFNTKTTSEPDENFMHFLVEKLFSYNITSLDIINIDTSAS